MEGVGKSADLNAKSFAGESKTIFMADRLDKSNTCSCDNGCHDPGSSWITLNDQQD